MTIFTKILQTIGIIKTTSGSDDIDKRKAKANLFVLQSRSYEIAEAYSGRDEEQKKLLEFATESIKKIDIIGGIPLGFSYEFVATYPDVVLWWNHLSDEKQEELLKNFDENDLLDNDKKIKPKYLKVLINAYINTGMKLECSKSIDK